LIAARLSWAPGPRSIAGVTAVARASVVDAGTTHPAADNNSDRRPLAEIIPIEKTAVCGGSGGGGNRTRVRGRTGQSIYKRSLGFDFARRPVPRRPTDGLAILKRRAAGDWLSLGAEPDVGAPALASGRARRDVASPKGYLGSECEIVLRICSVPGGFTRPTGDLGLQLYRRTDHVETRSPPYVCSSLV